MANSRELFSGETIDYEKEYNNLSKKYNALEEKYSILYSEYQVEKFYNDEFERLTQRHLLQIISSYEKDLGTWRARVAELEKDVSSYLTSKMGRRMVAVQKGIRKKIFKVKRIYRRCKRI